MARTLNQKEKEIFINNRDKIHEQLSELQADLEDMTNEELIDCRSIMLERVNCCMAAILETEEDNM